MTFPIEGKCPVCNEFPCTNIKTCWRVLELERELEAAKEYGSDMANEVVSLKAQLETARAEIVEYKAAAINQGQRAVEFFDENVKLRADLAVARAEIEGLKEEK